MNKINPYPVTAEVSELKNDEKIIQKEHFNKNIANEKLKSQDDNKLKTKNDKIKCMICGNSFTRSNRSKHNKTKHHIFCEGLNKKWRDTIIN